MPIKAWSTTASSNATADSASGISFAEGQSPGSLNDSNRAVMAELAEYFKDNDGTLTTGGTSTVYTATNNGSFTSLADGLDLSITIDETCGASPTLNVNGLGAKKFRKFANGVEQDLAAGDLVANGHYSIEYDSAANGGSGAWIVLNPALPAGSVIGSTYAEYTTNAALSTVIPTDDTIPQSTEGTQILSVAYTPASSTSKLRIRFRAEGATGNAALSMVAALFNGGTDAIKASIVALESNTLIRPLAFEHEYTPGSTSAITFTVRVGPNTTGSVRLNGTQSGRLFGGTMATTLVVEEIKA